MNPQYTKVYTLQDDLFTQQCTAFTWSNFEWTCLLYYYYVHVQQQSL